MMILQTSRANLSSGDQCSLDLPFAATKSLTARIGPTPVFTRASTATFVGSNGLIQSAANNEPRFDHDPLTLACKGLLIEESRTNLLARSEELGNAYWTISNASISENNQTSPNGSLTADTITVSAGTPSLYRAVACTASTLYTFSFYIKIGTLTPSDFKFAVRDDTNGVFIAENIVPNVTPVTTEWRRVTYTFTTPVGCVLVRPYLMRYSYLAAGTIYLWGAQLEAGSFPTSYIPTVAASVVRSADLCSITGAAFTGMYNNTESSIFVEGSSSGVGSGAFGTAAIFFDVALNAVNRFTFLTTTGVLQPQLSMSPTSYYAPSTKSYTANATLKQSVGIKAGVTSSSFLNNSAYSGGTNLATVATNFTALFIGSSSFNANLCNGHIKQIRYYKKRLPDVKLQTLTA
jgi:hypothetical protein